MTKPYGFFPLKALELLLEQNESLDEALGILQDYSLVQRNREGKLLSIHRLVQAVLQDELKETEQRSWAERAVLAVNAAFPKSEHGTWPQCERLLPHALRAAHYIEIERIINKEAGRLLHETASYLQERGRYAEAEPLYQRALHLREQQLGSTHPDVASSLNGLANLYREQGKFKEAELLYQRTLRIWEQQLGPRHPRVAYPLYGLAELYRVQGKHAEAEPLYQQALRIRGDMYAPHSLASCNRTALPQQF